MPNRDLNNMRESYESSYLLEEDCHPNPFHQFDKWFHHAVESKITEPNAMTLATVGADGQPSARIVLLKSFNQDGFVFYTNYESKKGRHLEDNHKAAILFWWEQRQVRIEGIVKKTDRVSAEQYFHSRPKDSQIGAMVSRQSEVLEHRSELDKKYEETAKIFMDKEVPLPDSWGGYVLIPVLFEFWQGRISRLHDRIQYTRIAEETWKIERLSP